MNSQTRPATAIQSTHFYVFCSIERMALLFSSMVSNETGEQSMQCLAAWISVNGGEGETLADTSKRPLIRLICELHQWKRD